MPFDRLSCLPVCGCAGLPPFSLGVPRTALLSFGVVKNFYRTRFLVPGPLTSANARVVEDLGIPSGTLYYISVAAVDARGHESLYAYSEYRCDASNNCSRPSDALDVTATR